MFQQDRQCTCNATLRHVRATIVAVEKQWILHTLSVCICSLWCPTSNAHAPYFYLCTASFYQIFPHFLIKRTIFEKIYCRIQNVFWFFPATFVWNISHSKKTRARYDKRMYIRLCIKYLNSCPILTKLEFLDIYSKNPQIYNFMKIHPVEPSCSMRTDRQTDRRSDGQVGRHDEANSRFCQFCGRA